MKYSTADFWTYPNQTRALLPLNLSLPFHSPAYLFIFPSIPAPLTRTAFCVLLRCVKFTFSLLPASKDILCSGNYSLSTAWLNSFAKVSFLSNGVFSSFFLACYLNMNTREPWSSLRDISAAATASIGLTRFSSGTGYIRSVVWLLRWWQVCSRAPRGRQGRNPFYQDVRTSLQLRVEAAVELCRARSSAELAVLTYLWCSTAQRSKPIMC